MSLAWCDAAHANQPALPPPDHTRAFSPSRVAVPPLIDGAVDDAAWQHGAIADGFWASESQQPPTDQTRVIAVYDDYALYFAFICRDGRPDLIRAARTASNGDLNLDDRVTVQVEPSHDPRTPLRFTVTAHGIQSDSLSGSASGDRERKGTWTAAARQTSSGWTAEMSIPRAMIEAGAAVETLGINFSRYQHRTSEWSEWASLAPRRVPGESSELTGVRVTQPQPDRGLTIMRYMSSEMDAAGRQDTPGQMDMGMDVRYRWGSAMTSLFSARPDFSGIDADVPGVGFSYSEKFVADRRPFFREGTEFFGDQSVFHSSRIADFDAGFKTFGETGDYQIGMLAVGDETTGRTDYVSRVVRNLGPTFNVSAMLAGTDRATTDGSTWQLKAGGQVGPHVRVQGDFARSSTSGQTGGGDGTRQRGELAYHASHWYSGVWTDRTAPDYFPANGFIATDVIGTDGRGAYAGYNRAFGSGWMRRADASVSYDARDTTAGLNQRETASVYADAETSINVHLNTSLTIGSFRPRGASAGEWSQSVNDDRYYLASAYYQSPKGQFGYGAQFSWGFVGAQEYSSVSPSIWLAPASRVSLAYSFERAHHDLVQRQHVLSGTWDIRSGQSVAARWVDYDGGYYRLSYRCALGHGVDAFTVYAADPYNPGKLSAKLVWTVLPLKGFAD